VAGLCPNSDRNPPHGSDIESEVTEAPGSAAYILDESAPGGMRFTDPEVERTSLRWMGVLDQLGRVYAWARSAHPEPWALTMEHVYAERLPEAERCVGRLLAMMEGQHA